MRFLLAMLVLLLNTACEIQSVKRVGYGKRLDSGVSEACFDKVFNELKTSTQYVLFVQVEKEADTITYYELTIDGTHIHEEHSVFTPTSYQLSNEFMGRVIEQCTAR
jgi:hypothetical protein